MKGAGALVLDTALPHINTQCTISTATPTRRATYSCEYYMHEDDKEQPLQRQMSQTNRSADTKTPAAHSGNHIVIQGRTTAFHGGYLHLMQRALASDGTHNNAIRQQHQHLRAARYVLVFTSDLQRGH